MNQLLKVTIIEKINSVLNTIFLCHFIWIIRKYQHTNIDEMISLIPNFLINLSFKPQ